MTYPTTLFDRSKPVSSDAGTAVPGLANVNEQGVLDMVGALLMQGYAFAQSGGTAEEPTTITLTAGSYVLKIALTWGTTGVEVGNIKTIALSLSTAGGGGPFTAIGSTSTLTYDGAGNLTSSTNWGGLSLKLFEILGKFKALRTTVGSHATTVAALQSMAFQAANGVAITDGEATLAKFRDKIVPLTNGNAANALSWSAGGVATLTVTGSSCSIAHSNLPNGSTGYMTLEIVNGGLAPSLLSGLHSAGALPTLSSSGRDKVYLSCRDGANVDVDGYNIGYT